MARERGETTISCTSKNSRNAQLLLTNEIVAGEKNNAKENPRKTEIPHNFMTPRERHARDGKIKREGNSWRIWRSSESHFLVSSFLCLGFFERRGRGGKRLVGALMRSWLKKNGGLYDDKAKEGGNLPIRRTAKVRKQAWSRLFLLFPPFHHRPPLQTSFFMLLRKGILSLPSQCLG